MSPNKKKFCHKRSSQPTETHKSVIAFKTERKKEEKKTVQDMCVNVLVYINSMHLEHNKNSNEHQHHSNNNNDRNKGIFNYEFKEGEREKKPRNVT